MAQYVLAYFGGDKPATPEEGQKHFAQYQAWLSELGDAVVSPMNPFRNSQTILPDGGVTEGSATGMSGYTILQAVSLDEALQMAKTCPFLQINGRLELSELVSM